MPKTNKIYPLSLEKQEFVKKMKFLFYAKYKELGLDPTFFFQKRT